MPRQGTAGRSTGPAIVAMAAALVLAPSALASLGADESTVNVDQAHLRGSLQTTRSTAFTVHEIRAESGTVVREYVAPSGKVFGVSWQGPFLPDMRQVMGQYFDQYSSAARGRRRRGPMDIRQPGLVFHMSGHARSFSGRAYLPELLPAGVAADAIK